MKSTVVQCKTVNINNSVTTGYKLQIAYPSRKIAMVFGEEQIFFQSDIFGCLDFLLDSVHVSVFFFWVDSNPTNTKTCIHLFSEGQRCRFFDDPFVSFTTKADGS